MAIFRSGPLIGAISGNLGGLCFVQSKAGPVIRKRNVRTRSSKQRNIRITTYLTTLRSAWRSLEDQQRTAWRQSAQDLLFSNRLGLSKQLTGAQLFIKVNAFGALVPDTPPRTIKLDPPLLTKPPPQSLAEFSVTSTGAKTLTMNEVLPDSAFVAWLFAARTFSTSHRSSWFDFRFLGFSLMASSPVALPNWDQVIGDPAPGEQCWLKIFQSHTVTNPTLGIPTGPIVANTFAL